MNKKKFYFELNLLYLNGLSKSRNNYKDNQANTNRILKVFQKKFLAGEKIIQIYKILLSSLLIQKWLLYFVFLIMPLLMWLRVLIKLEIKSKKKLINLKKSFFTFQFQKNHAWKQQI